MNDMLNNYNALKDFFYKTKEFIKINKTSPVTILSVITFSERNTIGMMLMANYTISHPIEHGMDKR